MTDPSASLPGGVLAASRVVRRAGYAIVKRDALAELRADRDRARDMVAALEAENARVRELHRPSVLDGEDDYGDYIKITVCLECDGLREKYDDEAEPVLWPCPTAAIFGSGESE